VEAEEVPRRLSWPCGEMLGGVRLAGLSKGLN
jgi:hypothetical protein